MNLPTSHSSVSRHAGSCTLLMYHVVDTPQAPIERQWCCPPDVFRSHLAELERSGRHPVTVARLMDWMDGRATLPERAVCITFDDGTDCFLSNAMPILQEYGMTATLYVISGLLGKYNQWSAEAGFPRRGLLNAAQVREIHRAGMLIGSHTLTHPDLTTLDPIRLAAEVSDSKAALSDLLGAPVEHFAYPFGRVNRAVYEATRAAGYRSASTIVPGRNRLDANPHLLRRIEVYNWDRPQDLHRKLLLGNSNANFSRQTFRSLTRTFLDRTGLSPRLEFRRD